MELKGKRNLRYYCGYCGGGLRFATLLKNIEALEKTVQNLKKKNIEDVITETQDRRQQLKNLVVYIKEKKT